MKNERGYIYINWPALFIGVLIIGILLGIAVNEIAEWAWPYIKEWIHSATA